MATSTKRVERDLILKAVCDQKVPVKVSLGSTEWTVALHSTDGKTIVIAHGIPLSHLRKGLSCEFQFTYADQPMAFTSRVIDPREKLCTIEVPDSIYRDLSRRYTRKKPPMGVSVSFQFKGDRYDLAFPTGETYNPAESAGSAEFSDDFDPSDIKDVVRAFRELALRYASEQAIVMFKDRQPESVEERLVARTGRAFFLPAALSGIPATDPWSVPRILIRDDFARHWIQSGIAPDYVEDETNRFEHAKRKAGVLSELMVAIPFQEYVIGYLHAVNKTQGKPPFDLSMVEAFSQIAKVLAFSLRQNGYFKNAPKKSSAYATEVIDMSAGGLLFICASSRLMDSLVPDSSILVTIKTPSRTISTSALIKRKYVESGHGYFGCEFEDIKAEDFRYLFELIYGRPFTDGDARAAEALTVKNLFKP